MCVEIQLSSWPSTTPSLIPMPHILTQGKKLGYIDSSVKSFLMHQSDGRAVQVI